MPVFITYYRVSTDRQGASGLGLDAQREAVARYIGGAKLTGEYTEIESGRKHGNRPQLLTALQECRKKKATLVIAKLDRLGRNVAFISVLMEGGVEFICCDNPHANRLMLHMPAAFAEHERDQISQQTKGALAAARAGSAEHYTELARAGAQFSQYRSRTQPAEYQDRTELPMVRRNG